MKREELIKRIKELELALRIICTWASCDYLSKQTRELAMQQIKDKCVEALQPEVKT